MSNKYEYVTKRAKENGTALRRENETPEERSARELASLNANKADYLRLYFTHELNEAKQAFEEQGNSASVLIDSSDEPSAHLTLIPLRESLNQRVLDVDHHFTLYAETDMAGFKIVVEAGEHSKAYEATPENLDPVLQEAVETLFTWFYAEHD